MSMLASDNLTAILGIGLTGMSCAAYLQANGKKFVAYDQNPNTEALARFKKRFPDVPLQTGDLADDDLLNFAQLIVSPGISLQSKALRRAEGHGVEINGDIELFRREVSAPILCVTGSNGKSTVTLLLAHMIETAGLTVKVGGNIGTPVLDLLDGDEPDFYVLELSSYQLERTALLAAESAVILNLSPDHMDRYVDFSAYHSAKQRIYRGCHNVVSNRQDKMTQPLLASGVKQLSFGNNSPDLGQYGIADGQIMHGLQPIMFVAELSLAGAHNAVNVCAAMAMGSTINLPQSAMVEAAKSFKGLPHRCEKVAVCSGVNYVNDSKGTNVGATLAAIEGLSNASHDIVLIAGGISKGADFSELKSRAACIKSVVLIGEAADELSAVFGGDVHCEKANSMQEAVGLAAKTASQGDTVLLSPACSSFDMYANFEARGDEFKNVVAGLIGGAG